VTGGPLVFEILKSPDGPLVTSLNQEVILNKSFKKCTSAICQCSLIKHKNVQASITLRLFNMPPWKRI